MESPHPNGKAAFDRLTTFALVTACIFCFCAGRACIPHLGLQNDESLFANAIYQPFGAIYWRWVFHHHIPVMLMSYLGALKSWIYTGVFHFWTPTASSIRTPMLLACVATVALTGALLRRVSGRRAAVTGAWLLATDSMFLLSGCFDWGPVALQHLLLMAGLLLLLRFHGAPTGRAGWLSLAGGFFCFGLGMWDKALFIWMLAGVILGALLVFWRELLQIFTVRRAAVAGLAFAAGALPLILYNAHTHMETLRANASYTASEFSGKARLLWHTADGSGLFGWLVLEDSDVAQPPQPRSALQRVSWWINEAAGKPRESLMPWAVLAGLLILPALWRDQRARRERRFLLFAAIAMAVGWMQMAVTRNAGGSVHHTILLWPLPVCFAAVALAAASRWAGRHGRAALAVATVLLAASNALVLNDYYAKATRDGGSLNWTDGIYTLADIMRYTPASAVYPIDWGILDSLRLLDRGKLPLLIGSDPLDHPVLNDADKAVVRSRIADSGNVFIAHPQGQEFFPGVRAHLLEVARESGYRPEVLHIIDDKRGRPVFEILRFVR